MKKTIFIVMTFLFVTALPVFAQTAQPAIVTDVEGLRAEFKEYTQSPDTKAVKFSMILNSDIDTDRLRITWSILNGNANILDPEDADKVVTVEKGKSYEFSIEMIPAQSSGVELLGKAEAFKTGKNYIATVKKLFVTNDQGEIQPQTEEYNSAKNISAIRNVAIVIIAIIIILITGYIVLKNFVKWLDRDERY